MEMIPKQFFESIVYHYMDNSFQSDSNVATLEKKMFEDVKKYCFAGDYKLFLENAKRIFF